MMGIGTALKSIFSVSKVSDTAVDIVRKISGTDGLTDKDKAKFVLDYITATQGQSISRRVIALSLTAIFVMLCISWTVATWFGLHEISMATEEFLDRVILQPFNIVIGFYFVISIAKGIKK